MNKLSKLKQKMEKDNSLPFPEATLVFGEGNPEANVLFIGEAPGFHEDQQGRPFVGRSGKLLDTLMEELGWKREDVYITNIVKRRPPQNRDPLPAEIEKYKPYLDEQIEIIAPEVIVPLGRFAMMYFIPNGKISQDNGKVFWWKDFLVMPVYHPAAILRRGSLLKDMKEAFAKLPKLVKSYKDLLEKEKARQSDEDEEKEEEQKALFT